ncbi:DUF3566 domain-containing protein [Corynebacterium liangguodongii]|uniref:Uncharacterized protein n=1 Tax=Corynebacterium liangguodongii TaxID=2079535 RepID=A0A2S0WBE7_9CORY|nr:DUF3566 domain-containing protein [Corynebacterium liangguodongii]AWB83087.1 hypothetical protein C3E79_00085 [Corynebacterium liangguodongii]PWB99312.1 hypothetical protein DF219_06990 [Corynebacterium liangguodongii]
MAARKVTITHVHPGSAFRVATLVALAGFAAWMIGASLVYFFLAQAGVVESINSLLAGVGGETVVDTPLVLSAAALIGLVGVVFVAVMAPLTAVMYNAIAGLTGGLTVTMVNR